MDTFCGVSTNEFGLDDAFAKFFRLTGDMEDDVRDIMTEIESKHYSPENALLHLPLDRLSLLACSRQGLKPLELLRQDHNQSSAASASSSSSRLRGTMTQQQKIQEAIAEAAENRRLGKLRLAENERRIIVTLLKTVHRNKEPLSKEQNLLLLQLRAQDKESELRRRGIDSTDALAIEMSCLQCNDAGEEDACAALLCRESATDIQDQKMKRELTMARRMAHADIEKMKALQKRAAVSDVVQELMRVATEAKVQAREKEIREHLAKRQRVREERAQSSERLRQAKREKCVEKFKSLLHERRTEVELRKRYRAEQFQHAQERQQRERIRRQELKAKEESLARERIAVVDASYQEYRSLLSDEVESKVKLSESMRVQQELLRRAATELKHAHVEQRRERVDTTRGSSLTRIQVLEKEVEEREAERERRQEIIRQSYLERAEALAKATAEQQNEALKKRMQVEEEQRRRREELATEQLEKEKRAEAAVEQAIVERTIRSELQHQRVEHHEENLSRVVQAESFRQALRASLLDQEEERDRKKRMAKMQHKREMTDLLTHLHKEKEKLADHIVAVRKQGASSLLDDAAVTQRESLVNLSREDITRQAESIVAKQMSDISRPMSASGSLSAGGSAVSAVRQRHHEGKVASRPMSAMPRRTPSPNGLISLHGSRHNLEVTPSVAKKLAQVDELDNFALEKESRHLGGEAASSSSNPVSDLVRRMNDLYYSNS